MVDTQPPAAETPVLPVTIPEALFLELEALKPVLEQNACVQPHNSGYRLRYRQFDQDAGYVIHRSLNLGRDPLLADAVRELLLQWKADREEREDAQHRATAAKNNADNEWTALRQALMTASDGGRDHRLKVGKAFDAAMNKGPLELCSFLFNLPDAVPMGKPGRKRNDRLW